MAADIKKSLAELMTKYGDQQVAGAIGVGVRMLYKYKNEGVVPRKRRIALIEANYMKLQEGFTALPKLQKSNDAALGGNGGHVPTDYRDRVIALQDEVRSLEKRLTEVPALSKRLDEIAEIQQEILLKLAMVLSRLPESSHGKNGISEIEVIESYEDRKPAKDRLGTPKKQPRR